VANRTVTKEHSAQEHLIFSQLLRSPYEALLRKVDCEPVAYALMLWLSRRTAPSPPRTGADRGSA
jgi:hypothetical protein